MLQRLTDHFCPSRILVSTEFTSLGLRPEVLYLQPQDPREMVLDRPHRLPVFGFSGSIHLYHHLPLVGEYSKEELS